MNEAMPMEVRGLGADLPAGFVAMPGTGADADEMVALEAASFSSPWTRKMFEGELVGNRFARFVVVRRQDKGTIGALAAYLCYWIVFDELRLMTLAVAPDARRQGLASWLVRQAIEEARQTTGTRALLEVRASNHPARALYRRLGFHETGVRAGYYTQPVEDAVLMALDPLKEVGAG